MKRYWHFIWYLAGIVGLGGLWFKWPWLASWFPIDVWFPPFCFVAGQLQRERAKTEPTFIERTLQSGITTKLAIASVLLVTGGITAWIMYTKYIDFPARDRAAIEEFKKAYYRIHPDQEPTK